MRVYLHIGLEQVGAGRLQSILAAKRDQMINKRVLFARSPGSKNHMRLFMSVSNPENVDTLRFNRGYMTAAKQRVLRETLTSKLAREIEQHKPKSLILSCEQLGAGLRTLSELERLKALLGEITDDIRIVAHLDEPAALLCRHDAEQVLEGRAVTLAAELALTHAQSWWSAGQAALPAIDPAKGIFAEVQGPAFWLDYPALVAHWQGVFGNGTVRLRSYAARLFAAAEITQELCAAFDIEDSIGKAEVTRVARQPSAASLARGRQLNALVLQMLAKGTGILPRQLWRSLVQEVAVDGPWVDPASLHLISGRLYPGNRSLLQTQPALREETFESPKGIAEWTEADPLFGYRASQYLSAFMWRIDEATRHEKRPRKANDAKSAGNPVPATSADGLPEVARALMPALAVRNLGSVSV